MNNRLSESRRRAFIEFALAHDVLSFGTFRLKSGRDSPYFFNAGKFQDAHATAQLGRFYAEALVASALDFDIIFGPAYKGIPLAVTTAVALADQHGMNPGVAYNRKEAKDHGEGGRLVGAPLKGRVVLVDDVITAGTAVREVLPLIQEAGGEVVGILTALDREEQGQTGISAVQELTAMLNVPVMSIVGLSDLVAWLQAPGAGEMNAEVRLRLQQYREQYGAPGAGAD